MAGQLLRLSLLLMSLICSSATVSTSDFPTNSTENVSSLVTKAPLFSALNDKTTSVNNNETSTIGSSSAKESYVSPAREVTQEETSTLTADGMTMRSPISKDTPVVSSTVRPYINLSLQTEDLPFTSHEDSKTTNPKVTPPSHPPGNTGNPKLETTLVPKSTTTQKSGDKDTSKLILILVLIVILILILVTVIIFMVRNKRRRGSQSFSTRSRSSNRQDVWAGQVPELGDGKMTPHPVGMENGKLGNKAEPGTEQEMSTFISGEKKDDSIVETNELLKGETLDEKKPLLEETSQVNEEVEKSPGGEDIPAQTEE